MPDKISTAKFLSVFLDETTDTSITEQEMFFIRYAEKGEMQTAFIGVMSVDRGTAPTHFQAFKTCLSDYAGVHWSEFERKCIAI